MAMVFYDLEATGPDPLHDQVLSAAAVLTDDDLNERDSFRMRCRLRPHQLPDAAALVLTGMPIAVITDPALPSHARLITALRDRFLAWQPAVFTGYSSLEFDEPLLAESLRRCLYPASLTGAARLDVQRLALGLNTFSPGAIAFVQRFDGKPSFRLADVATANGLVQGMAHDAMGDVSTTLAVARLMRQRAPMLWSHMLQMGRPDAAARFAAAAPVRLYTEFHHNRPHHWLVTALGQAPGGRDVIGFDLACDPRGGQELDQPALHAWLRRHPRPLRPMRVAECPFILPRELAAGRVSETDADARASLLAQDAAYRARLLTAHAEITPAAAAAVADSDLALQLRFEEDADGMDAGARALIEVRMATRMMADDSAPWRTLNRAFEAADAALECASDEEAAQIEALLDYLRREMAWAEARLGAQNTSKAKR